MYHQLLDNFAVESSRKRRKRRRTKVSLSSTVAPERAGDAYRTLRTLPNKLMYDYQRQKFAKVLTYTQNNYNASTIFVPTKLLH